MLIDSRPLNNGIAYKDLSCNEPNKSIDFLYQSRGWGLTLSSKHEQKEIFRAFKKILKSRKISYSELAKRTSSAESTIKRIFAIEECSISRMVELLNAVNLSLVDLVEVMASTQTEVSSFSHDAEVFFAEHLEYFMFYRKLFHHQDVATVQRRMGITRQQTTRYLRKLDELGIIEWRSEDRVRFVYKEFLRFREDGSLKLAVYRDWAPKFHTLVVQRMLEPNYNLRLFSLRCTPELKASFMQDFSELVDDFIRRADRETRAFPNQVNSMAVSLAVGPFRIGLDDSDYDHI